MPTSDGVATDYRKVLKYLARRHKRTGLAEMLGTTQGRIYSWISGAEPRLNMTEKIRALAIEEGLSADTDRAPLSGDIATDRISTDAVYSVCREQQIPL